MQICTSASIIYNNRSFPARFDCYHLTTGLWISHGVRNQTRGRSERTSAFWLLVEITPKLFYEPSSDNTFHAHNPILKHETTPLCRAERCLVPFFPAGRTFPAEISSRGILQPPRLAKLCISRSSACIPTSELTQGCDLPASHSPCS